MPIYAPDGGGVHVCGKKLVFYDNCYSFFDGNVSPLNQFNTVMEAPYAGLFHCLWKVVRLFFMLS